MSKNYNKYYNSNYAKAEKLIDPVETDETTNLVESEEVLNEGPEVEPMEAIEETIEPEVVEAPKTLYGIHNCKKLNVRTEPNKDGALVCVLDPTSSFEIEELESNPEWVKVLLDNGDIGFCMKMYVAIK